MHKLTNQSETPHSFSTPLGEFSAAANGGSCEVPDDAAELLKASPAFQHYLGEGDIELKKIGRGAKAEAPQAESETATDSIAQ